MAYQATVIPVMIASPSDVPTERRIIREVINEWNYVHSQTRRVVLMPTGWETHSTPEIGRATAQELINTRILEHCDLLVGVFWTRLGTPTGKSASGTAEEIECHIEAGKPALVYFSSAPVVPDSLDAEQYEALKQFKRWCAARGLIQSFDSAEQFRSLFSNQIGIELNRNEYLSSLIDEEAGNQEQEAGTTQVSLPGEAVELLAAALDDPNGQIFRLGHLSGLHISAGNQTFGEEGDRRTMARWEHAIEFLENYNLITDMGYKREVFELTQRGYQAADQAKAAVEARKLSNEKESGEADQV